MGDIFLEKAFMGETNLDKFMGRGGGGGYMGETNDQIMPSQGKSGVSQTQFPVIRTLKIWKVYLTMEGFILKKNR